VAERLRNRLRQECAARWPGQPALTVSIGIAETRTPGANETLVQRADAALYAAKAAGRDAVR
jgi:GGDEF domain-containing protein